MSHCYIDNGWLSKLPDRLRLSSEEIYRLRAEAVDEIAKGRPVYSQRLAKEEKRVLGGEIDSGSANATKRKGKSL